MTKSELKTGMIVTQRNGDKKTVYLSCCSDWDAEPRDVILRGGYYRSWDGLEHYREDLTHKSFKDFDIVKVELVEHPYDLAKPTDEANVVKTLWTRPEDTKKMTVAEIEAILGYKVEVVSEK